MLPSTRTSKQSFLGARCGPGTSNASSFADAYAFKFDLWGPAYSGFGKAGPCAGLKAGTTPAQASAACRKHVLDAGMDEAINKKAWVVRNFHGFVGDSGVFEPVAVADYRTHLDAVKQKVDAGSLWVAGPTAVVKYRFARQHCPMPMLMGNTLTFGAPTAACSKYATTLSYQVSLTDGSDPAKLAVVQGGVRTDARKTGPGSFVVDADPSKGDAQIVE